LPSDISSVAALFDGLPSTVPLRSQSSLAFVTP
jgi:hypothetical protein